jgi:purine-binding chemotaxis protein CheW
MKRIHGQAVAPAGDSRHQEDILLLQPQKLVIFTLDEQRYALHLAAVERVVRMVELTSLPKAPEIVLGVVNVRGRVVPVVNLRKRFGLAERGIRLSDHILPPIR